MKPTLTLIPIALLLASLAVLPAAEFPAGFSVGSDAFGPIVRVNVETIRDWSKVPGVKRFIPVPPAPGQTLPSHAVISNLKDVDGDGRIDVFCRLNETPYSHVARFDARGKQVWLSERLAPGAGDESGMPIVDLDGDGRYELLLGQWATLYCLDADTGKIKWQKELDKGGQPGPGTWDYPVIVGDGRVEVIYDHDGCGGAGPLYVVDGTTGTRTLALNYRADGMSHCQGFTCGDFDHALPGLELAVTAKAGPVLLYDPRGKLLWKRDTPNTLVTKGDWDGDGVQDILVFAIGVNLDPIWSVWNGQGRRLFAMSFPPSPTRSHATMCAPGLGFDGFSDLDGNGRADVLVSFGPWKTGRPQYLFIAESPNPLAKAFSRPTTKNVTAEDQP